jgi:hypothetical protein
LALKTHAQHICTPAAALPGERADHCAAMRFARREIAGQRPGEFELLAFGTGAMAR